MSTIFRCCESCRKDLSIDEFYFKSSKGAPVARFDNFCKECRRNKKRSSRTQAATEINAQVDASVDKASASDVVESVERKSNGTFKSYKYPDGSIIELTEEEFSRVVIASWHLLNAKRGVDGRPLLRR